MYYEYSYIYANISAVLYQMRVVTYNWIDIEKKDESWKIYVQQYSVTHITVLLIEKIQEW